jgi:hypothetical protein
MSGVEEDDAGFRNVALKGLGAGWDEEGRMIRRGG